MNKIKDFFYNKNDILVALLILAAATFIIYLRIETIMSYPDTLVDAAAAEQTAAETASAAPTETQGGKSITIPDKPQASAVAKQLETAGVISSAEEFEALLVKYKLNNSIRPGTVIIPTGSTSEQIIEILTGQQPDASSDATNPTE